MHTFTTAIISAFSFVTLTTAATSTTTAASSTSSASTVDVHVGQNNQLAFSPSSVTAPQGATINFHFYPANHSVGESLVRTPCRYTREGIWSGYVPVSSGVASTVFSVTLNDTDAHWLYSAQRDGDECQSGMVMVINPPDNPADTLDAYIKAAKIAGNSTDGYVVRGGLLVGSSSGVSSSTVSSQTSVTVASVTSTVASGTTGTTGTTASGTAVSGTSGTSASATAATTGVATGTGTGTGSGSGSGTGIGTTGAATAPSGSVTGSAASATNTGAANANAYKSSAGLGAGALLLSIWYFL